MSINTITQFTGKYELIDGKLESRYVKQPLKGYNLNKIQVKLNFNKSFSSSGRSTETGGPFLEYSPTNQL